MECLQAPPRPTRFAYGVTLFASRFFFSDLAGSLFAGYLKTEYRVHCRDEDSLCADHCRKFALSDPADEDFNHQCLHDHLSKCDSCEELKIVFQSVEGNINELCTSMYSKEQHDNLLYDFGKTVNFINEWKCHILSCKNQEIAKQSFIQNLTEDSVFIVMDWAMKFLQRRFREKQCDWYAKRGMNWHVSCAITSDGKGNFAVSFYNHLFDSCSQDWLSVLSILENLLITVRSSNSKVKKAYLKSDEAGCYHNVGERVGVSLQRYDFSEPQSGKGVCDRILCPLKSAIRRFCNEGHDVLTASDMHMALKERSVRGCTAAVCFVNETKKDLDIKKIQQFSAMHDFSHQQDGLRVLKAFQIGAGKLITWDEIYVKHQGATDLTTEQENFGFTPRVTHKRAHYNGDAESSCELGQVLECPEPACARTFKSLEEMELHISVGQHTESVYDKFRRGWVETFSSPTLSEDDSTNAIERQGNEPFQSNVREGWALHKPKGGAVRFSEKVRQYLISKFDIGEQSGRREDPRQVKGENGKRLFSREEWLTKAPIPGFFSRSRTK